jgi:hypothetical protein
LAKTKNPSRNGVATGGTIHPIAKAPLKPGERFGDVMLSPGLDRLWECGYRCPDTELWYRCDEARLNPTHWSPMPGQTIKITE